VSTFEVERIDDWVVDARLGSGGMGSVYRCHNAASERIYAAIKVLDRPSTYEDSSARFLREAEILFSLDHPNIVKVRSVSMESDPPYLEMEFVEGESLEEQIRSGPVDVDVATDLVVQALEALVYMHECGVCHRDLKPANLLMTPEGMLKIVDFGLAVQPEYGRLTHEGFTFGTVSYAPPEWGTREGLDPVHWDLYAVGVLFWELLAGSYAFPLSGEGNIKQQLMQVMMVKHQAPALDAGEDVPIAVRRLISVLTDPDPASRPPSARDALEWFRRGAPLLTDRRPARSPWVRPVVGVGFAMIGAALALATYRLVLASVSPGVDVLPAGDIAIASSERPPESGLPEPLLPEETQGVRTLAVRPVGLPAGMHFAAMIGGERPVAVGRRGVVLLPDVTYEPVELTWVAGMGCQACWEWEGECPPWCARERMVVEPELYEVIVDLGVQPRGVVVELTALAAEVGRSVFRLRRPRPRFELEGWLDGIAGDEPNHYTLRFDNVPPGNHLLRIDVGECPPEAGGCLPGDCPLDCRSLMEHLVVPWVKQSGDGELPDVYVARDLEPPQ